MKFNQVCRYFFNLLKNKKSVFFLLSILVLDKANLLFEYYFFRQEQGGLISLLLGDRGILTGGLNGVALLFYFIPVFMITAFLEEKMSSPYFILHAESKKRLIHMKVLLLGLVIGLLTLFYFIDLTFTHYLFHWLLYRNDLSFSVEYVALFKLIFIKWLQYFFLGLSIIVLQQVLKIKFIPWFIMWTAALALLLLPVGKWSILFFIERATVLHAASFFTTIFYLFLANLVLYFCLLFTGRSVSFYGESD